MLEDLRQPLTGIKVEQFEEVPGITLNAGSYRGVSDATRGMVVVVDETEIDGRRWRHLSVSRRSRTPSYDDLVRVRRLFFGDAEPAYQVFPRAGEHRNLHEHCLHLWKGVGFDPFPDPHGERQGTIA